MLQPSGVPKVAVRVSSDEREVQIRESVGGRIHPSPRAENYDRAEVLLDFRPDEETFDDAFVCQRQLVYVLSFTSLSAKARVRRPSRQSVAGSTMSFRCGSSFRSLDLSAEISKAASLHKCTLRSNPLVLDITTVSVLNVDKDL